MEDTPQNAPGARFRLVQSPLVVSLGLFLLALAPRLLALERYITPDELIWVYRSVQFREALLGREWLGTLVSGHPGVVTGWLGTLGISLQLLLQPTSREVYTWVTQMAHLAPDNMAGLQWLAQFLTSARVVVAVVNALGVVAVYWLARPLLYTFSALLAALLLALDPFVAGLAGLLHVDALMTSGATISLLALALGVRAAHLGQAHARRWLALAGAAAALAVLTKSPALLLGPVAALVLLLAAWRGAPTPADRLRRLLADGLVWLAAFGVTAIVTFPALWASPLRVAQALTSNANRHVEEALRPTFFLGSVAFDHGPLFYPVTLAWRLGPVVFAGLLILLVLLLWRRQRRRIPWTSLLLAAWSVLFLAGITVAAKKFDRYALPAIPTLTLAAAAAWMQITPAQRRRWLLGGLVALQAVYLLWFVPFPLAAYNPLMGGPATAVYVLPIGWGEAISASGRWLAGTPDAIQQTAYAGIAPSLAPFFPGETLFPETSAPSEADLIIYTANSRQTEPQAVEAAERALTLRHTVRYGSLDQAWIYANPQPQPRVLVPAPLPEPATFGGSVRLLGQSAEAKMNAVVFATEWGLLGENGRYTVQLRLRDEGGSEWARLETPLVNAVTFYPEHWAPGEQPVVTYRLPLPPAAPPGSYHLELALLDDTGAQQPVTGADGRFLGVVFAAGVVEVPPSAPTAAELLDVGVRSDAAWLGGSLRLLGHAPLATQILTGEAIPLQLFWQAQAPLPNGLQVALQLDGQTVATLPLSSYDTDAWQPSQAIEARYRLPVPPDWPAGEAQVDVAVLDADGQPLEDAAALETVEIAAVDRLFVLPDDVGTPLDVLFEPGIVLHGALVETAVLTPGEQLRLTLFWQTEVQPEQLITAFVHVIDAQGNIVAQGDQWPAGLPSVIWAPGQVLIDEYAIDLPPDLPPGAYRLGVGLYTPDGTRLPAADADGARYPDDRVPLPETAIVPQPDE